MLKIVETESSILYEGEGKIIIKPNSKRLYILFLFEIFSVLVFFILKLLNSNTNDLVGLYKLSFFASIFNAGVILLILISDFMNTVKFELNNGLMKKNTRTREYHKFSKLFIDTTNMSVAKVHIMKAEFDNKSIRILADTDERIFMILEYLNEKLLPLNVCSEIMVDTKGKIKKIVLKNFINLIFIGIGFTWTLFGYFFIPDVIWVLGSKDLHGPLVWPFGIWIFIIGIIGFLGFPIFDLITKKKSKWGIILSIVFFGFYSILCYR